jgi:HlyD family secretion protein
MRKRLTIILAVVAALAVSGWFLYQHFTAAPSHILTLQGNIDIRQANVGFRVTGRVKEMKFEEGDVVHAGDLVAELDDAPYRDQVQLAEAQVAQAQASYTKMVNGYRPEEIQQARAQLDQAKANHQNALRYFERQDALQQNHVISKSDYDNALASRDSLQAQVELAQANLNLELAGNRREDIENAKAQLDSARASLATAQQNLADCQLYAPVDGVIITRAVEPGTIVSTSSTIYSICQNEPVWVRTYVGERDLGRIYPGMKALVYNDTNPNHPDVGQIGFISPVAEFTPKTVETRDLRTDLVYRLRVIITKPNRYLRQGMPVTLRMMDEHHEPEQPRD